jgi:hypothetical protein
MGGTFRISKPHRKPLAGVPQGLWMAVESLRTVTERITSESLTESISGFVLIQIIVCQYHDTPTSGGMGEAWGCGIAPLADVPYPEQGEPGRSGELRRSVRGLPLLSRVQ